MISEEFKPRLTHPFYFIRRGLFKGIQEHASFMHGRMMDFGCGSKPYRELFQVDSYTGVDFENSGHPHINEKIDVFYDGNKLPFAENEFDSILCSEVFEHIFNLPEILAELARVLKENGKMLVTCPFVWNEHEVPHDYARYTRFALEDLMKKAGFRVVSFQKSGTFIQTIFQSWSLYWFSILGRKARHNILARWTMKYLLVLPINIGGKVANRILPRNDSLYLSNIILVEKVVAHD